RPRPFDRVGAMAGSGRGPSAFIEGVAVDTDDVPAVHLKGAHDGRGRAGMWILVAVYAVTPQDQSLGQGGALHGQIAEAVLGPVGTAVGLLLAGEGGVAAGRRRAGLRMACDRQRD